MSFTSPSLLLLALLVIAGCRLVPWSVGRWLLLGASYVFYGIDEPWICLILAFSTLTAWAAALGIERAASPLVRRAWLGLATVVGLGLLAVFKYRLGGHGPALLPPGISFYTFQTLAYVIDVYRGRLTACRDLVHLGLFKAFFPQLVAGPIERGSSLLPQLADKQPVSADDVTAGGERILIGLFKKLVLADHLKLAVDSVYRAPSQASAVALLLATVYFAFQLYLDFSGYTDIAIGLARLLGVRLSENFSRPLLAISPTDFWQRWHITLSHWFRDYVFTPLAGTERRNLWRRTGALLVTMTLVGLWHGASGPFLLFGFLAGVQIAVHQGLRLWRRQRLLGRSLLAQLAWRPMAALLMLSLFACFRAPTLSVLGEVMSGLFHGSWTTSPGKLLLYLPVVLAVLGWEILAELDIDLTRRLPAPARGLVWASLLVVVLWGSVETAEPFVYVRF